MLKHEKSVHILDDANHAVCVMLYMYMMLGAVKSLDSGKWLKPDQLDTALPLNV